MSNENKGNNSSKAGGVGFFGLLALIFITLKLTGFISWSWLWVLAPIWILAAITVGILLILLVVAIALSVKEAVEARRKLDASAAKYGLTRNPGESDADLRRRIAFCRETDGRWGR